MRVHEQLDQFFGEFFRLLRQTKDPSVQESFLFRAEKEFNQLGYRSEIPNGVENILIVRLDVVGDMVLTSGFIREVRANFPQARITLLVSPLVYSIVEFCPYVNEILTLDIKTLDRKFFTLLETLAVFCKKNLWHRKFSIVFSPQWGSDSLPSLLICWLSGAKERIGFGNYCYKNWIDDPKAKIWEPMDNFLLTKNIMTPRSAVSEIEHHFYLLEAVGLKVNQTHMELWFSQEDFIYARELLKNLPPTRKKVLLGIGASKRNRKYPAEKYLIALKELAKKNLAFVIVGGESELEDANFIEQNLPTEKVLNLVGKTTLRETEAIISQMDFYIGSDSGVMHMAAASQVPCLVLYREAMDKDDYFPGVFSEFQRFPPWQTKTVILRPDHQLRECAELEPTYGWCHSEEPHCITQITPQEIIEGFEVLEAM